MVVIEAHEAWWPPTLTPLASPRCNASTPRLRWDSTLLAGQALRVDLGMVDQQLSEKSVLGYLASPDGAFTMPLSFERTLDGRIAASAVPALAEAQTAGLWEAHLFVRHGAGKNAVMRDIKVPFAVSGTTARLTGEVERMDATGVAVSLGVEAAMADNALRAVVATSTLDLGIDWGDVDLVLHIGAPKGASRLAQRIGRANHRIDEPSRAVLVPANRFEVMECQAALDANYLGHQDTPPLRAGALDVLCQHILGMAVAGPFSEEGLYEEVISAAPYAKLDSYA